MDYEKAYFDTLKYLSDAVDILTKMRDEAMKPYLKSFKVRSINDPDDGVPYDSHYNKKNK